MAAVAEGDLTAERPAGEVAVGHGEAGQPPVIENSPLPSVMLRLVRLMDAVPVLETLPTMVPETETGPKVSWKEVLIPALMTKLPLPKVTMIAAGPIPPVRVPESPVGPMTREPPTAMPPLGPLTIMFEMPTLSAPVVESREKLTLPERVMPAMVRLIGVPVTWMPVWVSVTVTLPEKLTPVTPPPMLTAPLAVPVTDARRR